MGTASTGPSRSPASRESLPKSVLTPRRLAIPFSALGLGLALWTVWLTDSLPSRQTAQHWDIAWVGFDVLLIVAVMVTAWAAWTQRLILIPASTAAAALFVVDAWFDTMTASPGNDTTVAYLMAALLEIPAAIFFAYVGRRSLRAALTRVSGEAE